MHTELDGQNISKIMLGNPHNRLEAIYKAQVIPDPDAICESYRRKYDMIPCIDAAVFHLINPNFHQADTDTQSAMIQQFDSSSSDIFEQMQNKAVLSVGGIEAAAFLELGAQQATIYDSDFNPLNLRDHTNIDFHLSRFEPNTAPDQKFGLVIGSMVFDDGSELVDRFMSFDIYDYIRRRREDNDNIEIMRERIREGFELGAEDYRRMKKISIKDFCAEWEVSARAYWKYIQEKIDLPRDFQGNIIFDRPVDEALAGYGFGPEDIDFLKVGMITPEMLKLRKYREYAKAMWERVDEGGMMVIDGNHVLDSIEGLENCNLEATYTLEYNDEYRLVVLRKV